MISFFYSQIGIKIPISKPQRHHREHSSSCLPCARCAVAATSPPTLNWFGGRVAGAVSTLRSRSLFSGGLLVLSPASWPSRAALWPCNRKPSIRCHGGRRAASSSRSGSPFFGSPLISVASLWRCHGPGGGPSRCCRESIREMWGCRGYQEGNGKTVLPLLVLVNDGMHSIVWAGA
ncbi:hypothetical protein AAHA92_09725 [Salvia divinorum]|uniref:Uncharacterized protein n=1 Tax=Salvia divinorum TaxID=28513 RepID=A0ABD1HWE9_SALDI